MEGSRTTAVVGETSSILGNIINNELTPDPLVMHFLVVLKSKLVYNNIKGLTQYIRTCLRYRLNYSLWPWV